ncbi:MAG: DUF4251 domain-containing protein [Bacteroidales bacterium]
MKKILFVSLLIIAFISCSSQYNIPKNDKQAATMTRVESALSSGNYTIRMSSATPSGGRFINLNDNYTISVRNDSVISYLPYYGRSYRAPMSPDESGIKLNDPIKDYTLTTSRKGMFLVKIQVNNQYDTYTINMDISPTGNASVRVNSNNKTPISFYGDMVLKSE